MGENAASCQICEKYFKAATRRRVPLSGCRSRLLNKTLETKRFF
jgi:hypothetical protein